MASIKLFVFCLIYTVLEIDAQNVHGNCAVGSNCDHCPDNRVHMMKNKMAGFTTKFKVCCPNCNKYFFNFNVLTESICTCLNIPENQTNSQGNFGNVITNNGQVMSNTQGWTLQGNCWSGSNCSACNSKSYINGLTVCCPNCSGYGASISSFNGEHVCSCPQPNQPRQLIGNCLRNENCTQCIGASYMNGERLCCPNCSGSFRSLSSIGALTYCQCN